MLTSRLEAGRRRASRLMLLSIYDTNSLACWCMVRLAFRVPARTHIVVDSVVAHRLQVHLAARYQALVHQGRHAVATARVVVQGTGSMLTMEDRRSGDLWIQLSSCLFLQLLLHWEGVLGWASLHEDLLIIFDIFLRPLISVERV